MTRPIFTNNASTLLSAGINNSVTSVGVVDGSLFPSPTGGQWAYLTIQEGTIIEIVKLTARSGNTLTVTRAQDSTSAGTFTSAATVSLRMVKGILDDAWTALDANLNKSGGVMTGDIDMGDNDLKNVTLENYQELAGAYSTAGSNFTIADTSNIVPRTLSASINITLPGTTAMASDTMRTVTVLILQNSTGGYVPTFLAPGGFSLVWNNATSQPAANLSANKNTMYSFTYHKASTIIMASLSFYQG